MDRKFEFVDSFPTESAVWINLYFTEAVCIIFINIIIIITFSAKRQAFSRSVCLFINLAVSDMLYGVSLAVFVEIHYAYPWQIKNKTNYSLLRDLIVAFVVLCAVASAVCIFLVAIDRVLAIFAPFCYRLTKPKVYGFGIVICWFCCICFGAAQVLTPNKNMNILRNFYAFCISFGLLAIITLYTAIFIKLRSQNQTMSNNRTAQNIQQRERNMAYTSMIVTFCSLLTWMPIGIVIILFQLTSFYLPKELMAIAMMIHALNSFINPIIYAFRIRNFRYELYRVLCQCSLHRIHAITTDVTN